jgi:hypothetical protein
MNRNIAQLAKRGDLKQLKEELPDDFAVNKPVLKCGDTLLHLALSQNRTEVIDYLLSIDDIDVNVVNAQGVTPLMVAVVACPKVVPILLQRGADVTKRNWKHRKTALDLVKPKQVTTRKILEAAIKKKSEAATSRESATKTAAVCSCPYCGVALKKRRRIDYLQVTPDDTPYVKEFLASQACQDIRTKPEYHVFTNKRHLKKEISESWAILKAFEGVTKEKPTQQQLQLIDLCSGSSLTTTLYGILHPKSKAVAVDILSEEFAPHYITDNLSYLQADINKEEFVATLQTNHVGDGAVLVGMHLCGDLSIRAIEIFEKLRQIKMIILSPCCFPKHDGGSRMEAKAMRDLEGIKDETLKYAAWSQYLLDSISIHCTASHQTEDKNIMSTRNRVIVGYR